ncbi:MAG: bactofilin family protein [Phycisphaerales bacterium]
MTNPQHAPTCIGEGTTLKGDLTIETHAIIAGRFEGTISGRGALTILAGGSVKGTIRIARVSVQGAVEGDIHSPALTIAEGATVTGHIRCGSGCGLASQPPLSPSMPSATTVPGEPSIIVEPHLPPGPAGAMAAPAPIVADIETTLAVFERTLAEFIDSRGPAEVA